MEWSHGWVPSVSTMVGWQKGKIRVYSPVDRPNTMITMPNHIHWPRLTPAEEHEIRAMLAHPWIPDGQALEGMRYEQITGVDALMTQQSSGTPLLETYLRPMLFMDMPLTLVHLPSPPVPEKPSAPQPFPKHLVAAVLEKAASEGQTCPITLEPITPATSSITSCGHIFHTSAIKDWIQQHGTCPECRQTSVL